jgi:predicted HAD superfamily Cof-like phosphohydrolase
MKIRKCKCGKDIWLDDDIQLKLAGMTVSCFGDCIYVGVDGKQVNIERLIIDIPEGLVPDHKDRNVHNNLKTNLRPATRAQNIWNQGKKNGSRSRNRPMKSPHQMRVEDFMRKAEQDVPNKPTTPSQAVRLLRARLIFEEAMETIHALGVGMKGTLSSPEFYPTPDFIWVDVVDGCCDLRVVTTGTLSALGVQDESVQCIVDEANLRKFGPGGYKDANGKWIKPPNFIPPQEALVLELQQQAARAQAAREE